MRCESCGNKSDFSLVRFMARWDAHNKTWVEYADTSPTALCNECFSDDENIEFENGDGYEKYIKYKK